MKLGMSSGRMTEYLGRFPNEASVQWPSESGSAGIDSCTFCRRLDETTWWFGGPALEEASDQIQQDALNTLAGQVRQIAC